MSTEITGAVGGDASLLKTVYVDSDGKLVVTSGGGTTALEIQGSQAVGDTPVTANPVLIGGVGYDDVSSPAPITNNGELQNFRVGVYGNLLIGGLGVDGADAQSNELAFTPTMGGDPRLSPHAGHVFNGADWDRARGNTSGAFANPNYASAVILTAQTAAVGTNWTAFASQACQALDITNATGVDIEYRRGGSGNGMIIPQGASRLILAITDADEIQIRRVDTSNTQVTITAEALT